MSLIWPVTDVASGELIDVQRNMHMLSTNACAEDRSMHNCDMDIASLGSGQVMANNIGQVK